MIALLVDAGNTAVKWRALTAPAGTARDGRALREPLATLPARLAAEWPALAGARCLGTCVADGATRTAIEHAARQRGAAAVHWLGAQPRFAWPAAAAAPLPGPPGARPGAAAAAAAAVRRLTNGYADPLQLGADRWHALIGAFVRHPQRSLVVATSGTALTIDCLRVQPGGDGRFEGGVIVPGAMLMRSALAHGTAQLPLARAADRLAPDNTDAAIAGGIEAALAGSVERVLRRFAGALAAAGAAPPLLLIGGGGAAALAAPLRATAASADAITAPVLAALRIETDLVLAGIASRLEESGAPWATPPPPAPAPAVTAP